MQMNPTPFEVICPTVSPWMEQRGDPIGLRIDAGQIRPLVQVAVNAGQGEVRQVIRAAVDLGHNVLDVQNSQGGIALVKLAVFAPVAGSLPHLGSRPGVHCLRRSVVHPPGQVLQDGDEFVRPHVALVFRAFRVRELAFVGFRGQFLDARFKLWRSLEIEDRPRLVRKHDLRCNRRGRQGERWKAQTVLFRRDGDDEPRAPGHAGDQIDGYHREIGLRIVEANSVKLELRPLIFRHRVRT
jgi:hypothetical protein